jgi:outer membrane protein assembly factor BamB
VGGPSSPVITRDGSTVVVGGLDSLVHAFSTTDGSPVWTVPIRTGGQVYGSAAIGDDNSIYIGSTDGSLYKLKPEGGDPVWQYAANSAISSSPVIGTDGTIYFASENGVLHAVTPAGSPAWTMPLNCVEPSSGAISSSGLLFLTASFGASDSLIAVNLASQMRRWGRAIPDRGDLEVAPLIDASGAVVVTTMEYAMAFWGLGGPAESAWPMFQRNAGRTGSGQ